MTTDTLAPVGGPQRLMSLDALRGLTIAGMILVNNPGSWSHIYGPLGHATWNGWTPTDLVFPFFLFVVGVSMAFAMERRLERGGSRLELLSQAIRRAAIIFLLGLILAGFPDRHLVGPFVLMIAGLSFVYYDPPAFSWGPGAAQCARKATGWLLAIAAVVLFVRDFDYFQASNLRIPGVLQRIAVCYLVATLVLLTAGRTGRIITIIALLVGYQWIVATVAPPAGYTAEVTGPPGLIHDWIDVQVLGGHLYRERPDPEGLLSTIPAIATTLCGLLAGGWLRGPRDEREKTVGLFIAANLLLFAGLTLDSWIPINKKIWTGSYVLVTAGLAMHVLAICYWWIDVRQRRRWSMPFVVFGTNAIVVYVASSLTAKMLGRWKLGPADAQVSAKAWIYEHGFAWVEPLFGPQADQLKSLAFALTYVAIWLVFLIPLYRARIFVRV